MVTITSNEVLDSFSTEASPAEVELAIAVVSEAASCLEKRGAPEQIARALQVYAARHILTMQSNSGKGTVKSESAPSGASRSYSGDGRTYFELVKQLDRWGCVVRLLEGNKGALGMWSIG